MSNSIVEILLVEDNMDDAGLTIRALKKNNLANHLLHLQDGEAALAYLFSEPPNPIPKLILLDLKMPKIGGIEVLKKIKSDDQKKVIPVVMLTSSKEDQDIVVAYEMGANAYIVKPVGFDNFLTAVTELGMFWLVSNQSPNL